MNKCKCGKTYSNQCAYKLCGTCCKYYDCLKHKNCICSKKADDFCLTKSCNKCCKNKKCYHITRYEYDEQYSLEECRKILMTTILSTDIVNYIIDDLLDYNIKCLICKIRSTDGELYNNAVYKCDGCGETYCDDCNESTPKFYKCKIRCCYYCMYGSCFNNMSKGRYCNECYEEIDYDTDRYGENSDDDD